MQQALNNQSFDFKSVIQEFLDRWKLFAIFLFFGGIIAVAYVKTAPKEYKVQSVILFKTAKSRLTSNDAVNSYLEGSNIINQEKQFQNEIMFYRSSPLIKQVIKEMQLEVSYYSQSGKIPESLPLGYTNIYGQSPIKVIVNKDFLQPVGTRFQIEILDNESFYLLAVDTEGSLYDYKTDVVERKYVPIEISGKYKFGEQIQTDYSCFTVLLNASYEQNSYSNEHLSFIMNNMEGMALGFQKNLNVRPTSMESTLSEVFFTSDHAVLGIEFVRNLTQKYIDVNLDTKNKFANKTIEYIDRQLANISDSLGMTEKELQQFRTSHGVHAITEKSEKLLVRVAELEQEKKVIQQSSSSLLFLQEIFDENVGLDNIVIPSTYGVEENGILSDLLDQLSELKAERDLIVKSKQLKTPRLNTLNSSINNILQTISENIRFNLRANTRSISDINKQINQLRAEITRLPQSERRLQSIERKFNLTDAAYTSLLEKRLQAQIAKASTEPDCVVIEPTRFSHQSGPNSLLILVGTMFLCVLFPTVFILLINFFSPTIDRLADLNEHTRSKVIGYLPFLSRKIENVVLSHPKTQITEAFFTLRSNIMHKLKNETGKVILVTSSIPNEGKSFTSLNLATSFAKAHNKTLLIDCDLRKKTGHIAGFENDGQSGMSDYLIGACDSESLIKETEIENLDYVSSGSIPENVIELLSSPSVGEFIDFYKNQYDYVIIDTPPYGLLTDAFMLMQYSDFNVYMLRLGIAHRKTFELCNEDFVSKQMTDDVHFLVNSSGVKSSKTHYYHGSYYGEEDKKWYQLSRFFKRKK